MQQIVFPLVPFCDSLSILSFSDTLSSSPFFYLFSSFPIFLPFSHIQAHIHTQTPTHSTQRVPPPTRYGTHPCPSKHCLCVAIDSMAPCAQVLLPFQACHEALTKAVAVLHMEQCLLFK